jgi:hypothetical protein
MRPEFEPGYNAVINHLSEVLPGAHYLPQLKASDCSFIEVLRRAQLPDKARALGYAGVNDVVHLTETWTIFLTKPLSAAAISLLSKAVAQAARSRKSCTLAEGLANNPKTIYLTEPFTASAVAHELCHWLSHPHWGIVVEPLTRVNEGAAEWLTRQSSSELVNGIYDSEVAPFDSYIKEDSSNAGTLMQAYFNGELTSLKSVLKFAESDLDLGQSNIEAAFTRLDNLARTAAAALPT